MHGVTLGWSVKTQKALTPAKIFREPQEDPSWEEEPLDWGEQEAKEENQFVTS